MITISAKAPNGAMDDDAANLYQLMNVPPKDSIIGQGKSIVTKARDMSFVCGTRPGNGPFCSIILNNSPRVKSFPFQKKVSFLMQGDEASPMEKLWNMNQQSPEFISTDNKFRLFVSKSKFEIEFSGQ